MNIVVILYFWGPIITVYALIALYVVVRRSYNRQPDISLRRYRMKVLFIVAALVGFLLYVMFPIFLTADPLVTFVSHVVKPFPGIPLLLPLVIIIIDLIRIRPEKENS